MFQPKWSSPHREPLDVDRSVGFDDVNNDSTRRVRRRRRRPPAGTPAPVMSTALRSGIYYAPRVATPPYLAYRAVEFAPNVYRIDGYHSAGFAEVLYQGDRVAMMDRLALLLRIYL